MLIKIHINKTWTPPDKDRRGKSANLLLKTKREPRFVVLTDNKKTTQTIDSLKLYFPDFTFETEIKPSLIDNLMYLLNPYNNRNETILIYRNKKYFPNKR